MQEIKKGIKVNKIYIIDSLISHETEPKKEEGFGLPTAYFVQNYFFF